MKNTRMVSVSMFLFVLAAGFLFPGFYFWFRPLPAVARFNIQPPMGAEVLPSKVVSSGTFKIEVPVTELLLMQKTHYRDKQIIFSFGKNRDYIPGNWQKVELVELNYWLPKENGIFYHATEYLETRWPYGFNIEDVIIRHGLLVAIPQRSGDIVLIFISLGMVFILAGLASLRN